MFDSFRDHFGSLGPGSIFLNLVFSGTPYWELWGSVLEAWRPPNGRFWGSWAHFGLHFWWLLRVLRLLGTLQGALCAPRAAWIDFGSDFGSQMGGQWGPNASQNRTKNRWNFECIFWWNFNRKMEAKMSPNAFQGDAKMHKKIMQNFIDFLIEFLMSFGGFGRGPDPWFDWQGRYFRRVRPFQPRPEKPFKK